MPSCIIEFSKGLNQTLQTTQLVELVHKTTFESGLFHIDDIKTRAICCEHYMVGYGHSEFIHVTLKIMPGREAQKRKALSLSIAQSLSELSLPPTSITVEVKEIDKSTYSKIIC